MPVRGRPRNPLGQTPTRFRERRQVFVARAGETPGLMDVDTRADTVAAGTVRRTYRQSINFVPAPPPVDITGNQGLGVVTRSLRYKASTVFRRAGNDNTRFGARRPFVPARHNSPRVTIAAGNQQGRPTIRNRMTSFGRRVTPVNPASPAADRS
jgi:hypothetical protein